MSYRRKNETTQELHNFKDFCQTNAELLERVGLPMHVIENYDAFIYLLMHGGLWHHAPTSFNIEDLEGEKRQLYILLISKYLEAGFSYPGLSGLTQTEIDELKRS